MSVCFILLLISATVLYIYHINKYVVGWNHLLLEHTNKFDNKDISISVVIAIRNEEQHICRLIKSLTKQTHNNYELIIVNDHSTDSTVEYLTILQKNYLFKQLHLRESYGKKQAIRMGIEAAQGNLIVTTDADCYHRPNWLCAIASFYKQHKPALIIAPVLMDANHSSVANSCLGLEFMSLIATAAGAATVGQAVLCNAANMAFEKNIYYEIKKSLKTDLASGDDVFLMTAIKKHYPTRKIQFLKSTDAIVKTSPPKGLTAFLMQRGRWASKGKYYTDFDINFLGATVVSVNMLLFTGYLWLFFSPMVLVFSIGAWLIKSAFDFIILYRLCIFFDRRKWMWYFPLVQFVYPIYVVTVIIFSTMGNIKWKGRKI